VSTPQPTAECPQCGAEIPVHQGYLTWCDTCGWNLAAADPPPPKTGAEAIAAMVGERSSSTVADIVARGHGDRRWRVALAVAAIGVYLFVAALAVGGVWLEAITFPNPFAMLPVAAMLGAAWYARPRPNGPEPTPLERADHPTLYELAVTIADELGCARLDGIALTMEYNAWIARYGWRQRRVVTLGIPLLAVLTPQERAALLAHELAHERRGDTWRSLLVGTAGNALAALMELLEPEQMATVVGDRRYQRPSTLSNTIANLAMAFVSMLVRPFVMLFGVLEARQSQRSEYLADRLSADVAGTEAVRSVLVKSRATHTLSTLAASAAVDGDGDVIGRLRRRSTETPGREWLRIERVMAMDKPELYATHPLPVHRVGMVDQLGVRPPRVVVTDAQAFELERELLPHEQAASRELLERHRASIYR
jgi:Zn-dependent protease with chaperone function